jgi:hypothetical protein
MEYDYVVEVRDAVRDILLNHLTFEDANSAYHEFRRLQDDYFGDEFIVVRLVEPE